MENLLHIKSSSKIALASLCSNLKIFSLKILIPFFSEKKSLVFLKMDKNKLRNIIELVVRKEVKKQLSEIFINEEKEINLAETISKPKPKKVINKPKKQYTKNQALNEVLNNTKPLGSQEQEDYPTLGGGVLGSDNMAEVLGYGDLGMGSNKERAREVGAVETIKKQGVNVDAVPEDVVNALTRDYSGLMKAMDNKKKGEGNYRP